MKNLFWRWAGILVLLLFAPDFSDAEIYVWEDELGNKHFTDYPPPSREGVKVHPSPTPPPPSERTGEKSPPKSSETDTSALAAPADTKTLSGKILGVWEVDMKKLDRSPEFENAKDPVGAGMAKVMLGSLQIEIGEERITTRAFNEEQTTSYKILKSEGRKIYMEANRKNIEIEVLDDSHIVYMEKNGKKGSDGLLLERVPKR